MPEMAAVAGGVLSTYETCEVSRDAGIAELSIDLTVMAGMTWGRPDFDRRFWGTCVEVLLDAPLSTSTRTGSTPITRCWARWMPRFEEAVNRMAPRPTERPGLDVGAISHNPRLVGLRRGWETVRTVEQVMGRVGLNRLPETFAAILFPRPRRKVRSGGTVCWRIPVTDGI